MVIIVTSYFFELNFQAIETLHSSEVTRIEIIFSVAGSLSGFGQLKFFNCFSNGFKKQLCGSVITPVINGTWDHQDPALTNPDLPSIPTLPPELEKRRLFESLLQLLLHLAGSGTLLLIIEDIHWSDETSLEFLHLLARTLEDPLTLAQSLNRLGNWQANVGDPLSALEAHQEALAIFEAEQNRPGIAATLDLIGTVHGVTGNIAASVEYYRRALPLLEALDDWQGMASTLTMLTTGGFIAEGERAVTIARQISWRDGEAYAHIQLAMAHTLKGEFGLALDHAGQGLHLAREIEHLLWQTIAHQSLGMTYQFMLAFDEAENSLSRALELAKTGCVPVWRDTIAARLTSTRLMSGHVENAAALLADTPTPPPVLETLGSRFLALAQAELALARQQPQETLEIINTVLKAVPHLRAWRDHNTLPLLLQLRGQALIAANRLDEAADPLRETINLSRDYEVQVWRWRCHAELSRLHLHRKEYAAAETELATATRLIAALAASIPEAEQRQQFQAAAQARLPQLPSLTPLQQRKKEFSGLTHRERQVAALVAQGRTNKEIAAELFITVRTVKSHLTNILAKLDFTSRSQVAVWAVEVGLLK